MWLHPIITMVVRRLAAPATDVGWDLPAGLYVAPTIILSHAAPDSFPAPGRFRLERLLEGDIAPQTWIPFGGGVRSCIGAGFSLMEGVLILREILLRYAVSVAAGRRERVRVRNI